MEKRELENLKSYLNIYGHLHDDFTTYSKVYSMTTENIFGFLCKYDLCGKRVLTVAGSGDQRLNSYLMGASDVICFDVNDVCELHLKLKDEAIKNLDLEDFIKFFGIITKKNEKLLLDASIFDKFKRKLDWDARSFYEYIVEKSGKSPGKCVYYESDTNLSKLKEFDGYLNGKEYEKLAKILEDKKVDFLNVNVCNLPEELAGEKFDMILLSNISDYIHYIYPNNALERYRQLIDRLIDNLNLYGVIQVGYTYSKYHKWENVSDFHIKEKRSKVFTSDIFHSVMVNSFYQNGTQDKVITYQKVK